jgi:GntR family transcriptional repressor for pyruvate dehydrogenase complex
MKTTIASTSTRTMANTRDLKIERPRGTLTDRVTEKLVEAISAGDYPMESRLPTEKELAERFGVSRTVVREAVSRLKSEGLVESHQGKGAFVRRAASGVPFRLGADAAKSMRSVLHILELRRCLEAEAAALAAARRSAGQLAEIRRTLRDMHRAAAWEDSVEADAAFHRAVARATGNPHYLALWDFIGQFLHEAIRLTRSYEAQRSELGAQVNREHEAMADAIARGDADAARAAARRHLEMAANRIASADEAFWHSESGRSAGELAIAPPTPSRKPSVRRPSIARRAR